MRPLDRLGLEALADALDRWPQESEVTGTSGDGELDVLVVARTVGGVLVVDEPVVFQREEAFTW